MRNDFPMATPQKKHTLCIAAGNFFASNLKLNGTTQNFSYLEIYIYISSIFAKVVVNHFYVLLFLSFRTNMCQRGQFLCIHKLMSSIFSRPLRRSNKARFAPLNRLGNKDILSPKKETSDQRFANFTREHILSSLASK